MWCLCLLRARQAAGSKQAEQPVLTALSAQRLREGEVLLACDGDMALMKLTERERAATSAYAAGAGLASAWGPRSGGLGAGRYSPTGTRSSSAFSSIAAKGGSRSALRGLDLASASTSKAKATRAASGARRAETGLQIRTKKERDADRRNKLKLGSAAAPPSAAVPAGESVDLLGLHSAAGPSAPPGSPTGAVDEREFQKQGGLDLFADIM